jgi:hypothetical protein
MRKTFKLLGFLFTFIAPFAIVYMNYAVLQEGGVDINTVGLLIIGVSIIGLIKYIEHKTTVLEIQDRNKMFRVIYSGGKKIAITVGLWWAMITITTNIDDLVLTLQLLTFTFTVGLGFNVLGNRK